MAMLVKANNFLNPTTLTSSPSIEKPIVNFGDSLFNGPSCHVESLERLSIVELFMFGWHSIIPEECACPLLWWIANCHKWVNVAWLRGQILTTFGSQIKIE
jgi:hypothetical protein